MSESNEQIASGIAIKHTKALEKYTGTDLACQQSIFLATDLKAVLDAKDTRLASLQKELEVFRARDERLDDVRLSDLAKRYEEWGVEMLARQKVKYQSLAGILTKDIWELEAKLSRALRVVEAARQAYRAIVYTSGVSLDKAAEDLNAAITQYDQEKQ